MHYVMIAVLMVIAPLVSILIEATVSHPSDWPLLIGKWFIFWGVGVRLLSAGIKQVTDPAFTAGILGIKSKDARIVIRELGFANAAIGTVALVSVFNPAWLVPAAIAGAIFYGAAGFQHLFKARESAAENVALVSDLFMFVVSVGFLFFHF
jgi:hypothetical protein